MKPFVLGRPVALCAVAWLCASSLAVAQGAPAQTRPPVTFVFTSDAHFGLTRGRFRGAEQVDAAVVNAALVAAINALPDATFPRDGGLGAGERIGALEAVIEGGDIANRAENGVQPAQRSWSQFDSVYRHGLHTRTGGGAMTPLWMVPGNHDASNAIGFYRPLLGGPDAVSMMAIYNAMMRPATPVSASTYHYDRDRVHYTRDIAGVHVLFLHIWPDSTERAWMDRDLRTLQPGTPALIFTHDQPDVEAKHFRNPHGQGDINEQDRFENLLTERLQGGGEATAADASTEYEQRMLAAFLKDHPAIQGYFHGNSNGHEFYTYGGPDHDLSLPTFRVDSPMKGDHSAADERLLSFMVITLAADGRSLTARECLWNAGADGVSWGETRTIPLYRTVGTP